MTSKLSLMQCHIYNNEWQKNCWWTEFHFKQKPVCSHFFAWGQIEINLIIYWYWEFQTNLRDLYALPVSGCNFAGLVQNPSSQTMWQCSLWKFALQSFSSGTQCLVQKNEFSIQKDLYIVYITTAAIVYDTADILRDRCPKQDSNNMKNCRTSKQHTNKLEKLHCLRKKDVCIN